MMSSESHIREAFAQQADACAALGSPFTERLCRTLSQAIDRTHEVGRVILDWSGPPDARGDALPLRLAGALHALVLRGDAPNLKRLYPPNPLPEPEALWASVSSVFEAHEAMILTWLNNPPQTNEVARCGVLYPGLQTIAAITGLPLALFEIGSSAGLNLMADRFSYQFGPQKAGDSFSPVRIAPTWKGPLPPQVEPQVMRRLGCDRSPLDPRKADDRERLIAYVWPDQTERLVRLIHAIKLAEFAQVNVAAMDAAHFVEQDISIMPEEGVCRVLFHSIAFQYFTEETKARISAQMAICGLTASRTAPLAWLAFEMQPEGGPPRLTLTLWPDGHEIVLAEAHPHGQWVHWQEGGGQEVAALPALG